MERKNRFVIHLTEEERQAIESLAAAERLPPSTFARRRLLLEATLAGYLAQPEPPAQPVGA